MHPFGGGRLIFRPSEDQIDHLCAFFQTPTSEEDGPLSPLPLAPEVWALRGPLGRFRINAHLRNPYERKLPRIRPTNRHVALVDQTDAEKLFKEVQKFLW